MKTAENTYDVLDAASPTEDFEFGTVSHSNDFATRRLIFVNAYKESDL